MGVVGFDTTEEELRATADANGLVGLAGLTPDLHVATEWRNDRERHPRIVALARGYNPSVHGLRFFSRASSGELAAILLEWAENKSEFTTTPQHRVLLKTLREARGLRAIRSLDGVAAFLAKWSEAGDGAIGRPRDVLPTLGLLRDPRLFEAKDLAKRLEHNLRVGERVTVMSPGDIRQRRERATRYDNAETAAWVRGALDRLEAHRRGRPDADLTLEDAEQVVTLPPDKPDAPAPESDGPDVDDEPAAEDDDTGEEEEPGLREMTVDALLEGREEDLAAIGEALADAWEEFDQNGDRLAVQSGDERRCRQARRSGRRQGHRLGYGLLRLRPVRRVHGGRRWRPAASVGAPYRVRSLCFWTRSAIWKHNGISYSIETAVGSVGWGGRGCRILRAPDCRHVARLRRCAGSRLRTL